MKALMEACTVWGWGWWQMSSSGDFLHEVTRTDLEHSPEMTVVMFKNFPMGVKILITASLLNYLQEAHWRFLKLWQDPETGFRFAWCACVSVCLTLGHRSPCSFGCHQQSWGSCSETPSVYVAAGMIIMAQPWEAGVWCSHRKGLLQSHTWPLGQYGCLSTFSSLSKSLVKRLLVLNIYRSSPILTFFRLTHSCGTCVWIEGLVLIYLICIGVDICCLFAPFLYYASSAPNLPSETAFGFQLSWKHWHILRYHFSFIYCKWWFVSCLLPEHLSSFV